MIDNDQLCMRQIVPDSLMGSRTTRKSALYRNRKFIGIEIDKEKFEIAKHRILT
jgi:DNA modification methylase